MTSSVMVGQSLFGQELFWTVELFISLWFQAGRGTSSDAMGDADFFNNSMYTIKMLPTNFKKMQSESAATHHHDLQCRNLRSNKSYFSDLGITSGTVVQYFVLVLE